jgi:CO/xanthine dehydrogenase FAD-binding subunit
MGAGMALHKLKDFHTPGTMDEALTFLANDADALVLSGGTFLHGLEARGLLSDIEALVDIRKIGLGTVGVNDSGLDIGATVTFARLQAVEEIRSAPWLAALSDALAYPPVQIRNAATVGGCVAASCPFFDIPTALIALDAIIKTRGPGGVRQMPLPEFFDGLFANVLESGELVTGVSVLRSPGNTASAFIKLEGNANDLAIVNAAVLITVDASRTCTKVRVALGGGVAESALRIPSAEKILLGSKLDAATLHAAGEAVVDDIAPMSDHRASAEYRSAVAKVMTRRALERAVARLA